jgi:glyoxylate/hydroxypyruvate reductase A
MKPIILMAINESPLVEHILACAPQVAPEVEWVLPTNPLAKHAKVAACWYPDASLLTSFPHLECLHSVGAGDDNLGALLSSGLHIERIIDHAQKVGMFEYVLWGVLYYHRDMDRYNQDHRTKAWQPLPQHEAKNIKVGVLGLGEIGRFVAIKLAEMGYQVSGWARSPKHIEGVTSYHGEASLPELLGSLDILVNLLPLNPATVGILNKPFLSMLPTHAALINCGRGDHLVEEDLAVLLSNNLLRGAILDVFKTEPLPEESHLRQMDNVFITPHIASSATPEAIIQQISNVAIQRHA